MLEGWFREGRALSYLKGIDRSLARIAAALEERNLVSGSAHSGTSLRTFYEDRGAGLGDADYQAPTDEYFRDLELLEEAKRRNAGEAADLSDEDIEGIGE